jgi:hypothetical protein
MSQQEPHRAAMIGSFCLPLGLPALSGVRRSSGLHQIDVLAPIHNWSVAEVAARPTDVERERHADHP